LSNEHWQPSFHPNRTLICFFIRKKNQK